ncbi:MAG: type II toxin-antitoxin system death-on-curing family toxin [Candidatus Dormibacteraceae bacterium]
MPRANRKLISFEELIWLHTVSIAEFGGSQSVRDRGLLESALDRSRTGFEGHSLHATPIKRAADLAEALIQNHGFIDGNKRTAMYAMGLWLDREGLKLEAAQNELVEFALGLAEHQLDLSAASVWLETHVISLA